MVCGLARKGLGRGREREREKLSSRRQTNRQTRASHRGGGRQGEESVSPSFVHSTPHETLGSQNSLSHITSLPLGRSEERELLVGWIDAQHWVDRCWLDISVGGSHPEGGRGCCCWFQPTWWRRTDIFGGGLGFGEVEGSNWEWEFGGWLGIWCEGRG